MNHSFYHTYVHRASDYRKLNNELQFLSYDTYVSYTVHELDELIYEYCSRTCYMNTVSMAMDTILSHRLHL